MAETSRRRRKKTAPTTQVLPDSVFWSDTRARIDNGQITPFVGDAISVQHVFKSTYDTAVEDWSAQVGFPWAKWQDVTTIAQYAMYKEGPLPAKRGYLSYIKDKLLDVADKDKTVSDKQFETAEDKKEQEKYTFTEMAQDLGYLNFTEQPNHPLYILASLPFPIYITTSYHRFLEFALKEVAGKQVRSEIYPWNAELEKRLTSVFQLEPGYQPDEDHPLVYHLYGRDDVPESLVLTENDYLDFLINISYQMGGATRIGGHIDAQGKPVVQGLPVVVENSLGKKSSPLLLGYDLPAWDFRVLYRGLMVAKERDEEGMCIQVPRADSLKKEAIRQDLERYLLTTSRLKIYWGTHQECLQELHTIYNS